MNKENTKSWTDKRTKTMSSHDAPRPLIAMAVGGNRVVTVRMQTNVLLLTVLQNRAHR